MKAGVAEVGLDIAVFHFPPGTSKWNTIEHRLFSFITQNWRGKPLVSHEVIVNLIAAPKTRTGLHVKSPLDTGNRQQQATGSFHSYYSSNRSDVAHVRSLERMGIETREAL